MGSTSNIRKVGIDLVRYIRGKGPDQESVIKFIRSSKKMILYPRAYEFENYFIVTEDSTFVSAAKKVGHSTVEVMLIGKEEDAINDIKRLFRTSVHESNYGGKEMANTILNLEKIWKKLFIGTSQEENFYDHISAAIGFPKEIVIRAVKTREPTGITKEDLNNRIREIKEMSSNISRISKVSDFYCPGCGHVEKLHPNSIDRKLLPHFINAAIITKVNYMLQTVPLAEREGTLKLIRDGVQRLISQQTKIKWTRDENSE